MNYKAIGKAGIKISTLGMGCWSYGGGSYWGEQSQKDVDEVVSAALDMGINYFDSAEVYNDGESEASLGKALFGRREKAVIGTKISTSNTKPLTLRQHCEDSLKRLKTDYIDIYMLHWPINEKAIEHFSNDKSLIENPPTVEEAFETLKTLQKEGKIREIGVSNHGVEQMTEVMKTGVSLAVNELPYNLISRAIESDIAPFCVENKIGILGYMAFQQGILAGIYEKIADIPAAQAHSRHFTQERGGTQSRHFEDGAETEINLLMKNLREMSAELKVPITYLTLPWTLNNGFITTSIVGSRDVLQLQQNYRAMDYVLSDSIMKRLDSLTRPILEKLGSSPDYYENRSVSRIK